MRNWLINHHKIFGMFNTLFVPTRYLYLFHSLSLLYLPLFPHLSSDSVPVLIGREQWAPLWSAVRLHSQHRKTKVTQWVENIVNKGTVS